MMPKYIIGIDLGATNIKAGIVGIDGTIRCKKVDIPTSAQDGPDAAVERTSKAIEEMLRAEDIERKDIMGVGIGVPGSLDLGTSILIQSPNLPGWENYSLKEQFEFQLNLPVSVDNDANAAALGEYWLGAGQKYRNLICLTLGTGIGGGVLIDGKILRGIDGVAGELGHISVVPEEGRKCECGNKGCVEAYAGAAGIVGRAVDEVEKYPDSSLCKMVHQKEQLTPEKIYEEAVAGDNFAKYILEETGRYLGIVIADLLNIFNPEIVVLSGAVSKAKNFLLPPIREEIKKRAFKIPAERVEIKVSELGENAGIIGAVSVFLSENNLLEGKEHKKLITLSESVTNLLLTTYNFTY